MKSPKPFVVGDKDIESILSIIIYSKLPFLIHFCLQNVVIHAINIEQASLSNAHIVNFIIEENMALKYGIWKSVNLGVEK